MNSLKELTSTNSDFPLPYAHKTMFWDTFVSNSAPKYRTIPVTQKIDAMKVTGISIENVSAIKELEKANSFSKTNTFFEATKLASNSKAITKPPTKPRKANKTKLKKTLQNLSDSVHSLLDRLGQGSLSEPNLPVAKDRGDSIAPQNICKKRTVTVENNFKHYLNKRKPEPLKKQIVKACMFIKNAGNVYKSVIEAKKLQLHEINSSPMAKNMLDKNMFENKGLKFQTDEDEGFDVAIYLSGLMCAEEKCPKQNMMNFGKVQQKESKMQNEKLAKKKKSLPSKSNTPYDKTYEIMNKAQKNPSRLQKAKKCDTATSSRFKTQLTYKMNKPDELDLLADDSDAEYELHETGVIVTKRKPKNSLDINSNEVTASVKPSESGRLSQRSRKSSLSSRSKIASQSSFSRYSDVYGFPKQKITEEEMWENFEMIFKSYASTSRHSGEVIPRKISTEWMVNAGVVGEIMTQKQADDAFRGVAGAKITMNAQEYKNFLISLSLKMKLPYYEIYRRMCGI